MRILVSGSSGLVGSALIPYLQSAGHRVDRLVRTPGTGILWDPVGGYIDRNAIEGCDVLIHLAAENIGSGYWTKSRKNRILTSRVRGTRLLAETINQLECPPKIFISASATGFYGDRGDSQLTETSTPGKSFLAEVCQAWEEVARTVSGSGTRCVQTRFGLILARTRGILPRLILPYKFGFGLKLGSGNQYQSWIILDDVLAAIRHIIETPGLAGPVNVVAPRPVTQVEFSSIIGEILHRPLRLSVPDWLLQMILGDMARELVLASARVVPEKLTGSGFMPRFTLLADALHFLFDRK